MDVSIRQYKGAVMKITQESRDQTVTLKLEGNFTYTQRKPFQEAIKNIDAQNGGHVIIDLSQVAFPGPTVRQIIELANLQKTIPLIESDASPRIRKTA